MLYLMMCYHDGPSQQWPTNKHLLGFCASDKIASLLSASQQLININEGLLKGDRWKLTKFVSAHKETLQHGYSRLTIAQKNGYAAKLIKMCAEKQDVVCNNSKSIHRNTTMSFAAMDQEWTALCSHLGIEDFDVAVRGGIEDLSGPKLFFMRRLRNLSVQFWTSCCWQKSAILPMAIAGKGRGDKHLKHILDWNACPMAPDHACTKVRNYLATKNRNQALLLPPITDVDSAASSSSPSESTAKAPQKWKNLFGFVDLPVTPEQAPVQISNCFGEYKCHQTLPMF
ncbi:hypothetical protein EV702DRAFT_1052280 [Suillus placidus]|uniref:Uncharacterized protein n=1 Tax=Suillus placidus TaxID=48579 RepID=A0A9P7CV90_9AGAM|nr:hypothetical protein EV702DRAFT_1052280 [Suillus placidus]